MSLLPSAFLLHLLLPQHSFLTWQKALSFMSYDLRRQRDPLSTLFLVLSSPNLHEGLIMRLGAHHWNDPWAEDSVSVLQFPVNPGKRKGENGIFWKRMQMYRQTFFIKLNLGFSISDYLSNVQKSVPLENKSDKNNKVSRKLLLKSMAR